MRKVTAVVALSLAVAGLPAAREPELYLPGPGGNPLDLPREVIWIDTPDFSANVVSSEVIVGIDLETEIANDFVIEAEGPIEKVTWWGTYWNGFDGNPKEPGFILRFYMDAGCAPEVEPFQELLVQEYYVEALAYGGDLFSQFIYEACVDLLLSPGIYWFSVQMAEHAFPVQWGRLGANTTQSCGSCVRSVYFGYPNWTPVADIIASAYDATQMIEDECIGIWPTKVTSWGAIKGLYR